MKSNLTIVYITGYLDDTKNNLSVFLKKNLKKEFNFITLKTFSENKKWGVKNTLNNIEKELKKIKSEKIICISHSLGCYFSLKLEPYFEKLILCEPSRNLEDIFPKRKSYQKLEKYEEIISKIDKNIYIFGAKQAGYKIAEKYNKHLTIKIPLEILPTDHNFSTKKSKNDLLLKINKIIKKPPIPRRFAIYG